MIIQELQKNTQSALRGKLSKNISLASYTSWRVGGPAQTLFEPADLDDLIYFLSTLSVDEPLTWLGLGSNTLIREGGVEGTVIITQGALAKIEFVDELIIRAEAGVACPAMARHCARQSLEGVEYLAGIPGTIGGALAMNAGCHGGEIWNQIIAVETIDRSAHLKRRFPEHYKIAYRSVNKINDEWFVAGHFKLNKGSKEVALAKIRALLAHRTTTQPAGEPSCGSVFRNPPGDYAARLIEACGLKGARVGNAVVSTKHANFILNEGGASATDIEQLIELVQASVQRQFNILLLREVHILGTT